MKQVLALIDSRKDVVAHNDAANHGSGDSIVYERHCCCVQYKVQTHSSALRMLHVHLDPLGKKDVYRCPV